MDPHLLGTGEHYAAPGSFALFSSSFSVPGPSDLQVGFHFTFKTTSLFQQIRDPTPFEIWHIWNALSAFAVLGVSYLFKVVDLDGYCAHCSSQLKFGGFSHQRRERSASTAYTRTQRPEIDDRANSRSEGRDTSPSPETRYGELGRHQE
jgi:hypothetical protein